MNAGDYQETFSTRWMVPLLVTCCLASTCASAMGSYKPADGPLMTRWAKEVGPKNALPEYPRPQMVRDKWLNLNGLWDYAITARDAAEPTAFDGKILVPYPIESALSGVMKQVGPDKRLWYSRTFSIPARWRNQRVLLHFGAVDWEATVFVNGKQVATHRGGYDPFSADITDALEPQGQQRIVVSVWDPTDAGSQPRGKQIRNPHGIWYTAVTGIWQTVWIEPVNAVSIGKLSLTPDIDAKRLTVGIGYSVAGSDTATLPGSYTIEATAYDGKKKAASYTGVATAEGCVLEGLPKLWSPDEPFLYDLKVALKADGQVVDEVAGYFGMRKISLGKDETGYLRLCLNNKPLFQYGPLDQGWWPDGLYTAPTDEALAYDLRVLKELGCNMLRKHVKVEPSRLYYWCDKLGLLVWQDMPNGNNRGSEARLQFELEWKRIMEAFHNHPSIVMWVPFNEGWGQHDTERYVELTKQWDPSRLVNNASGWTDRGVGDVHDIHSYPGPATPPAEPNRAAVLGEFGGLGLPLAGHTWQAEKNWGYRSYTDRESLTTAYLALLENLRPLISEGLSAAVYTQTTDVEIEVNGWMTYDREIVKVNMDKAHEAAKRLYLPPPIVTVVVPTSQAEAIQWRFTTDKPADGWEQPGFDDSPWKTAPAGFGTQGTPGTAVRTEWRSSDIWLRRTFELGADRIERPYLSLHHDEDAEVYINGKLATSVQGYTTGYIRLPISDEAAAALKPGPNTLAVHCKQTTGGQYIDAGIVEIRERQ